MVHGSGWVRYRNPGILAVRVPKFGPSCNSVALYSGSIENAVDEWRDRLWSRVRANYWHASNCCESINIHSAIRHEMFPSLSHTTQCLSCICGNIWQIRTFDLPRYSRSSSSSSSIHTVCTQQSSSFLQRLRFDRATANYKVGSFYGVTV